MKCPNRLAKTLKLLGGFDAKPRDKMAENSPTMVGHIERGEKFPIVETLATIAKALNIDLYKLFIFED